MTRDSASAILFDSQGKVLASDCAFDSDAFDGIVRVKVACTCVSPPSKDELCHLEVSRNGAVIFTSYNLLLIGSEWLTSAKTFSCSFINSLGLLEDYTASSLEKRRMLPIANVLNEYLFQFDPLNRIEATGTLTTHDEKSARENVANFNENNNTLLFSTANHMYKVGQVSGVENMPTNSLISAVSSYNYELPVVRFIVPYGDDNNKQEIVATINGVGTTDVSNGDNKTRAQAQAVADAWLSRNSSKGDVISLIAIADFPISFTTNFNIIYTSKNGTFTGTRRLRKISFSQGLFNIDTYSN